MSVMGSVGLLRVLLLNCKIIMQNTTKLQFKSAMLMSFSVNMKVLVIVNSMVIAEIH